MQYAFLEKLAADGHINASDKGRIYGTCSEILSKAASFKNPFRKNMPTLGEALLEQGQLIARRLLPLGAIGGVAYLASKGMAAGEAKKINICKMNLLQHPDFSAHPEKAEARFDEVVKLAPAVAAKPELAMRLVRNSLHSGFTNSDIQRLAQLQATYEKGLFTSTSSSDAVHKALSKKASESSSQDTGKLAATIVQILAEAGLGNLDKIAATPWKRAPSGFDKATNIAKQVLTTGAIVSGFGALVGLGTGAINQAADIYKNKQKDAKLRESFLEAMRRSDPGREPLHANKEKALQAFQTLTHFAPHVASDPEAARAFMLNLISMDQGVQVGAIKDLSEIEKNLKAIRPENPFLKGFQVGAETAGMKGSFGESTKDILKPFVEHGQSEIKREMGY
jgi:hypothetical protein